MPTLTQTQHLASIILSEGDESYSRDNVTVTMADGVELVSGSVLTKSGTKFVKYVGGTTAADAVLLTRLPAQAAGDAKAVAITRMAELNGADMALLDANAITKLALVGIIVRSATGLTGTY